MIEKRICHPHTNPAERRAVKDTAIDTTDPIQLETPRSSVFPAYRYASMRRRRSRQADQRLITKLAIRTKNAAMTAISFCGETIIPSYRWQQWLAFRRSVLGR